MWQRSRRDGPPPHALVFGAHGDDRTLLPILPLAVSLSAFFIGYVVVEVPSNWILKAIKPHRWITMIMVAWSIVMTLMGLVRSGKGLAAARFFLGVAEGGLFPGINFMLVSAQRRMNTILSSIFPLTDGSSIFLKDVLVSDRLYRGASCARDITHRQKLLTGTRAVSRTCVSESSFRERHLQARCVSMVRAFSHTQGVVQYCLHGDV